ncbi:nitrile hydratase [Oceanicola sp. 22II-s10i]|uniref:nitrile hydratase subunit beta n=1 Tax=Oceanicola sp. 22II-s10i TaxID=1317116 RepID=UPI000B52705C|nr:nitrile hydratase subunit beta [Oceanicola sp. 22II-s10i]OWU82938.1 nitrile hydratase [Oceanicola sp. 22II-s10i]
MNGPHDIGGMHGFGPVDPGANAAPYHSGAEGWEERAMAITIAAGAGGHWTIDESRFARENRSPSEYHSLSYFQIWLAGLRSLLQTKGLVTSEEFATGHAGNTATTPAGRCLTAEDVPATLKRGGPVDRPPGDVRPALAPGDRVRTRNLQPRGHIRLPAYARDKEGWIVAVQGYHVFADTSAKGDRDTAHWLYTVGFRAGTLWGDAAEHPADEVTIDVWEPYLDRL